MYGAIAQLVERFVYTEDVSGSSPFSPICVCFNPLEVKVLFSFAWEGVGFKGVAGAGQRRRLLCGIRGAPVPLTLGLNMRIIGRREISKEG